MEKLEKSDALYFLLTLACSSNIGSALTYTGNPQNMIVAQDSLDVLAPWVFFAYMILPSLVAWGITTHYIQRSWLRSKGERLKNVLRLKNGDSNETKPHIWSCICFEDKESKEDIIEINSEPMISKSNQSKASNVPKNGIANRLATYIVASPFPFAMILLMCAMIVLIFCNLMSIAGLVCVTAMAMVVFTVCGNQWAGNKTWIKSHPNM